MAVEAQRNCPAGKIDTICHVLQKSQNSAFCLRITDCPADVPIIFLTHLGDHLNLAAADTALPVFIGVPFRLRLVAGAAFSGMGAVVFVWRPGRERMDMRTYLHRTFDAVSSYH